MTRRCFHLMAEKIRASFAKEVAQRMGIERL